MLSTEDAGPYYRQIKKTQQEVSVKPELQTEYEEAGFSVTQILKTRVKMAREWSDDVEIENRIYCCMFELGIEWLSPETRVQVVRVKGDRKEVDVLAATDNAIFVFEAKCYEPNGGSLTGQQIDALATRCDLVRRTLAREDKRKVLGIFVTINSSHTDRIDDYGKKKGITILRSEDIDLYRDLRKAVGEHGKYMFFSRIMAGKEIPALRLELPAICSRIGNRTSYSFAAHPEDLLQITYVAHRTGRPSDSYQRLINKRKIAGIRKFVDDGGVFPTNVIIAFDDNTRGLKFEASDKIGVDKKLQIGKLIIPGTYGCAWVVDGQHRLLGYAGNKWAGSAYLHVTAYEKLPKSEQAQMFDDINSNQTKVPKNHLAELDAILHDDSTDPFLMARSAASQVLQELAQSGDSVFNHRIITSATPARGLCEIPLGDFLDRIQTRTGPSSRLFVRKVEKRQAVEFGPLWTKSASKLKKRLRSTLEIWFQLISDNCPKRWAQGKSGLISSQRGVAAMMRYLTWSVEFVSNIDFDSEEDIRKKLSPVAKRLGEWWEDIDEKLLIRMNKYGSSGVPVIVAEAGICLDGKWAKIGGDERQRTSKQHLLGDPDEIASQFRKAELACIKRLRKLLLELYSDDEQALSRGLDPKDIGAVTERWAEGGASDSKWSYLWFIDIKKAIAKHWEHCQSSFEFEGRGKAKGLSWLIDLNSIRNTAVHGGGLRAKKAHGERLQVVLDELEKRGFDISGNTESLDEK